MLPLNAVRFASTFKDVGTSQPLIGCGSCIDRHVCGGLHLRDTGALLVDCLSFCHCEDRSKCDMVCPNKPAEYVRRHEEVDGWDLSTIPLARDVDMPRLPEWIPLLQGNLVGPRITSVDDCVFHVIADTHFTGSRTAFHGKADTVSR